MPVEQLNNGRVLEYAIYGDPDGIPVLFNHGLSDSHLIRNPGDTFTDSLGVRIIAVSQPGVAQSTPQPGRRLKDWGHDIEQFADAIELDKFAVAGHSGGGPHALAIAAHLPDRVTHGVLAAPIAPIDLPEFSELVESKAVLKLIKHRHSTTTIHLLLKATAWWAKRDIEKYLDAVAKADRTNGNPDTFLADEAQKQMFEKSFTQGFAQGAEGIIEMVEALWDWEFGLESITQHFDIFFGDLDTAFKPQMGSAIAAAMPDATAHIWPGAGHYGFVDRSRWGEFFGTLVK